MERLRKNVIALPAEHHQRWIVHWKVWMFVIGVVLLLWSASALSDDGEGDVPFAFGDSCELLEQLTPEQLKSLT